MPGYDYDRLRNFDGKVVEIRTTEDEAMRAIVGGVYQHEEDLAYRVLATNQPERYRNDPPRGWSVIPWEYIVEIKLAEAEQEQR